MIPSMPLARTLTILDGTTAAPEVRTVFLSEASVVAKLGLYANIVAVLSMLSVVGRGGLANGWGALGGGHILKATGTRTEGWVAIHFPKFPNVNTEVLRFSF